MDEIRFTQPQKEEPKEEKKKSRFLGFFNFRKILKFAGFLAVLVVVVAVVFWGRDLVVKIFKNKSEGVYSAVFLTNGQVYFGLMVQNNESEIILNNVFYIQVNEKTADAANALGQPSFNLVKLGNELHGPTDELFINRSQIVFYEELRDDSKVVESIKNYKQ